jgi:hypothetical protein
MGSQTKQILRLHFYTSRDLTFDMSKPVILEMTLSYPL